VDCACVVDALGPGGEVDLSAAGVDGRNGDDGGAEGFQKGFLLGSVWRTDVGPGLIGFVEEDWTG